ncbi:hypothetical protein, partial [Mangrovicoccus sp. HB161399]|uniref:hypothetical protein n=1 Tax=Mangrovicoccus sp. HB161399 TaxID=2720392 RepID=UPI001553985D
LKDEILAALAGDGVLPPTVPEAFGTADWTLAGAESESGDELLLEILYLPEDGGDAISALEFRVGGGAAQVLSGIGTGVRTIRVPALQDAVVQIRAVNSIGAGAWSIDKTAVPTESQAVPSAFTTGMWTLADSPSAGGDRLTVTVSAMPDAGSDPITALEYRVGSGAAVALSGSTTGTYQITVPAGAAASVQLRAVNAVGAGAWGDVKAATPTVAPAVPAAFTAGQWSLADSPSAGGDTLTVTIGALPDEGSDPITALEYRVGTGAAVALSGTVTGSYSITVPAGAAASIQLRAVNAVGAGAWGDAKIATPTALQSAPAAFTAGMWTLADSPSAGGDRLTVTISTLPSPGTSVITSLEYRVGADAAVALSGSTTGTYQITVPAETAADVQLRAVNAVGAGAWGDTKTVTPTVQATAPSAFADTDWSLEDSPSTGGDKLWLTIGTVPDDGNSALTSIQYRIGTGAATDLPAVTPGSYLITVLAGAEASVQVRTVNAEGASAWSTAKTATPTVGTAAAITFGSLTPIGQGSAPIAEADGTYGQFTVASGRVSGNTSPLATGNTVIGSTTVSVTAGTQTVSSQAELRGFLIGDAAYRGLPSSGGTIWVRPGDYDNGSASFYNLWNAPGDIIIRGLDPASKPRLFKYSMPAGTHVAAPDSIVWRDIEFMNAAVMQDRTGSSYVRPSSTILYSADFPG